MSELTVLDPIEKLFVNTRDQISDQFRLRKLKMRLGTVGDTTAMTAEQFTGLFWLGLYASRWEPFEKKRFGFPPGGGFRFISRGGG